MDLSSRVLGQTVAKALAARIELPVLVIGSDRFTRGNLAHVECFNFIAAATINKALADLAPTSTRDLFNNFPPTALALPRIGAVALAVIGAAFQAKGIGGDHPLEKWVANHAERGVDGIRTFQNMKHKLQQEAAAEKKDTKQRKASRKNRAHEMRVARLIERAADKGAST